MPAHNSRKRPMSAKGDSEGYIGFRADSALVTRVKRWCGDYPHSLIFRAFLLHLDERRRMGETPADVIAELERQPTG